jgi:hypothetical protein
MPRAVVTIDRERRRPEEVEESALRRRRRERAEAARRVRQRGRSTEERRIGRDSTQQLTRRGQASTAAGRSPGRAGRQGAPTGTRPTRREPPRRRTR